MKYRGKPGQVSYGEAVGILLIENYVPYIPGDTANATTYRYPVRFQRIPGLTVERMFSHDMGMYPQVREAALQLQQEGVRAVTGDCGFLAVFQTRLAEELDIPVFLSSLIQLHFIARILSPRKKIGVITANARALDDQVLSGVGVSRDLRSRLLIQGLEDDQPFADAVIHECGTLDAAALEQAVVDRAAALKAQHRDLGAVLLECSVLPPYGAAVQEAVDLPVFDYITMIDYVYASVVKQRFHGFM